MDQKGKLHKSWPRDQVQDMQHNAMEHRRYEMCAHVCTILPPLITFAVSGFLLGGYLQFQANIFGSIRFKITKLLREHFSDSLFLEIIFFKKIICHNVCSFGGGKNKLKWCFHDLPSIQLATTGWSYKVWGSRSHSQHFIYSFCLFVPSPLPNSLCLFTGSLNIFILFIYVCLYHPHSPIHSVCLQVL
jgi:hypothetical protein